MSNGHDGALEKEQRGTKISSKENPSKKNAKKEQKQANHTQVIAEKDKDKAGVAEMKKDSKANHQKHRESAEKEVAAKKQDNGNANEDALDNNGNLMVDDDQKEDTLEGREIVTTNTFLNIYYEQKNSLTNFSAHPESRSRTTNDTIVQYGIGAGDSSATDGSRGHLSSYLFLPTIGWSNIR